MKKQGNALFEPLPTDSFWVKEVKAIKEVKDYDLEFGKRYLLEILALENGEAKFMDLMKRAYETVKTPPFELEELEFNKEEDELFDRLPIASTKEKFLRSKGWLAYGLSSVLLAGVTALDLAHSIYEFVEGKDISKIKFAIMATEAGIIIPADTLLFFLLKYTSEHEIDDTKYEELNRAIGELTEKFPNVFVENSFTSKITEAELRQEIEFNGQEMFI